MGQRWRAMAAVLVIAVVAALAGSASLAACSTSICQSDDDCTDAPCGVCRPLAQGTETTASTEGVCDYTKTCDKAAK